MARKMSDFDLILDFLVRMGAPVSEETKIVYEEDLKDFPNNRIGDTVVIRKPVKFEVVK